VIFDLDYEGVAISSVHGAYRKVWRRRMVGRLKSLSGTEPPQCTDHSNSEIGRGREVLDDHLRPKMVLECGKTLGREADIDELWGPRIVIVDEEDEDGDRCSVRSVEFKLGDACIRPGEHGAISVPHKKDHDVRHADVVPADIQGGSRASTELLHNDRFSASALDGLTDGCTVFL
jgi:hypothetical protein